MKIKLLLFAISSLLSAGCASDNPIQYECSLMPIVTGLWVTREDAVGTKQWGEPGYPNPDVSTPIGPPISGFKVSNIYPNPCQFWTKFRVTIPAPANVKIWATTAQLLGELEGSSTAGSIDRSTSAQVVATILESSTLEPGVHEFKWELNDKNGNPLPAGFYRIYFQYDNKVVPRDIFIASETNLGPLSLQKLVL